MKLEQSFEVQAPVDQVWAALIDVERVAPCLPGAAVTGRNPDGTYNGTFTIKIGPTTASYTGKLEMRDVDESARSATMHAQGSDRRGQGGAAATINSRLSPLDGLTRVEVVTDYHITGRLARFGRGGMIEDISERLLREFASRLQASLTYSGAQSGPVNEQAGEAEVPAEAHTEAPSAEMSPAVEESEQPTTESPRLSASDGPSWAETRHQAEPPTEPSAEGTEASTETPPEPPTEVAEPPTETPPEPAAEVPEPAPEPPTEAAPPHAEPPPAPPPHDEAPPPPPPHADAPPPHAPPPPQSEPLEGVSMVGSVLLERIKRNPAPVIGVIGGLVVLRLIVRRR